MAVGIASAFGKQNAAVVVPLLLAGLAGARTISLRLALAGCAVVGAGIIVVVLALPHDVRAWVLFVPLNQPYEFWPARIAQCWHFLTFWEPYLAVSFVPAAAALVLLGRRCGRRALFVDVAALVALAVVAFTGYFKTLGIWNNLTFLAIATIPYAGALFGTGFLASYRGARAAAAAVAFLTLFALGIALRGGEKQVPDTQIYAELSAVDALATQLCATKQPIAVTVFPQAFFGCPTAIYALVPSLEELQVAFPRYYAGPTAFDRPIAARYAVVAAGTSGPARPCLGLPGAWKAEFPHMVKRLTAVQGWGANYFPVEVRVFEHR